MNIIIDRPKLVKVVKLYLTNSFGSLTPKKHKDYPDWVFYVDSKNQIFMEYDKKNKVVWIDYNEIWSKLQKYFYLEYDDIKLIMKDWLEETYKLKGVTPIRDEADYHIPLEETYKLKGVTPMIDYKAIPDSWRNITN